MIRTLASLSAKANAKGIPISLCGEIAGDPTLTSLLIGLGFRSFSLSPGRLLEIKHALRSVSVSKAEMLAKNALSMRTIREVETLVNESASPLLPISLPTALSPERS